MVTFYCNFMRYQFSQGFRLVVPYLDQLRCNVKGSWEGREAGKVLKLWLPFLSECQVKSAFDTARIKVNGMCVDAHTPVSCGQHLEHLFHRHEPEVLDDPLGVMYIDEGLVVLNKPCSVPVHPIGRYKRNTVTEILQVEQQNILNDNKQLNVVHRLDKLVSGLLILARSSSVASCLGALIKQRKIVKEYVARVQGVFPAQRLEVNEPIRLLQDDPLLCGVCPSGKPSLTIFEREAVLNHQTESLVRCWPVTGRLHQIRVHLKWLGHPIVNDVKYGGTAVPDKIHVAPEPYGYPKVQWCKECQAGKRDISAVRKEDLISTSIWLHALSYSCDDSLYNWHFNVPRPKWASG